MAISKIFLSADAFQEDCIRLARKVYEDQAWRPSLILALWRGGAQPGVILCEVLDFLGLKVQHAIIKCASYEHIGTQSEVKFFGAESILNAIEPGQRVLVVDDVFDSGRTAAAVRQRLAHADARFAMVYWKPQASQVNFAPDYYVHACDQWIVFPHELMDLTPEELYQKSPKIAALLLSPEE